MSALFAAYRFAKKITDTISEFNFKLSMINLMYRTSTKKNSMDQDGKVILNSIQYLRLICAVTPPLNYCCSSEKHAT